MTVISTGSHHLYTPIWRDRMSSAADGCRGSPAPPAGGWTGEGVATTRRASMRASGRLPEPSRSPRRSAPDVQPRPKSETIYHEICRGRRGPRSALLPASDAAPASYRIRRGPMTEDLGWSRTEFTLAQTVGQIVSVDSNAGDGGPRVNPSAGIAPVKSPTGLAGERRLYCELSSWWWGCRRAVRGLRSSSIRMTPHASNSRGVVTPVVLGQQPGNARGRGSVTSAGTARVRGLGN